MNPNKENQFASVSADMNAPLSRFPAAWSHKSSFNAAKLIPIAVEEVLPGDRWKLDLDAVVRGSTPLYPVMDTAFLDVFAFFVPNRLSWEHWKEFMGENNSDYWTQKTEYSVPRIIYPTSNFKQANETFWNYVGAVGKIDPAAPVGQSIQGANALYPRGYARIWNDWFRDENTQNPAHIYTDDTDRIVPMPATGGEFAYVPHAELGMALCPVDKFHDYFTSCLPAPQKHAPIALPLQGNAPIVDSFGSGQPVTSMKFFQPQLYGSAAGATIVYDGEIRTATTGNATKLAYVPDSATGTPSPLYMSLTADLSDATAATINEIRLAFQTQKYYERLARSGSRYTEYLAAFFNVYSSDARLQRSEYLGGKRVPLNQHQVAQTSEGTSQSPLANVGAFSHTQFGQRIIDKSFEEHGILYVVACVRPVHTYCQGIARKFKRRNLFDYYVPTFAHIGETPVYLDELYSPGKQQILNPSEFKYSDTVFGYQEAWAEYRSFPSMVSGYMRPDISESLAGWHYGDNFASAPALTDNFMRETPKNIDRTLAVSSDQAHQYIADFYFHGTVDRRMPVHSVPGLVDHF